MINSHLGFGITQRMEIDERETIVFGKLTVVYWMLKETMPPVEVLYVRGEKCFQKGLQINYRVGRV